jgi:hypothetical protein
VVRAVEDLLARAERAEAERDVLQGAFCEEDRGPNEPAAGPCGACIRCARRLERDAALARAERAEKEVRRLHEANGHARRVFERVPELLDALVASDEQVAALQTRAERAEAERDVLAGAFCEEDRGPNEPAAGPCGACIRCARHERDAALACAERAEARLREMLWRDEARQTIEVCRDLGCTNTATHGPDGEALVCWEHAGNFPRCRGTSDAR